MLPDPNAPSASGRFWSYPEPHLRRAAGRLRRGSDAPGGAGRHAAGDWPL